MRTFHCPVDYISASCVMEAICERYENMTEDELVEALIQQHLEADDLLPD